MWCDVLQYCTFLYTVLLVDCYTYLCFECVWLFALILYSYQTLLLLLSFLTWPSVGVRLLFSLLMINLFTCNFTSVLYNSFINLAVIMWPLMLFKNWSLSLLSMSLYLYSVTFTLSLPIHSSADSSECLTSLQHYSNNII